jgi:hypothetical protein
LMSSRLRNLLLTAAAAAVALTLGCTQSDTPLSPRGPLRSKPGTTTTATVGTTDGSAPSSALDELATFRTKPQITIAWAKAWIGPEGGRLDFIGFTVIVPPGAVDKVTMFTIRLPVDPKGSEHVIAEFGPHNTQFARPLTIGFPLRNTSIEGTSSPTVVWWNNGWVEMGGVPSADGAQLFTQTTHFSDYGTTTSRGGTLTASGG